MIALFGPGAPSKGMPSARARGKVVSEVMHGSCQGEVMSVALVTGPTAGIGEAFARRLANDGHDLVLVARDSQRLATLATEFESMGVRAEVMVADLADRQALKVVEARLSDDARPVDVLVNNAGFGLNQRIVGGSVETEQAAIDVMVTAVMRLSHAAAPGMKRRGRGLIINVSSIAAFMPLGSYSAAKSWGVAFTQGLHSELSGTGVNAIAVCPGLVHTQFHKRAGMDMSRASEWMWLSADQVVSQTMSDAAKGKSVSVAGLHNRTIAVATRVVPPRVVHRMRGAIRGKR